MKFSVTATFTALFLVVAGFYVTLVPQRQQDAAGLQSLAADHLLRLKDDDDVEKLRIQIAGSPSTITLERSAGKWKLTEPVEYPADPLIADGLATALKLSPVMRRLVPEKGWAEYGLEESALVVGVKTVKQKDWRLLHFGDNSPLGDMVYARWDGEKEYVLVKTDVKRAFQRSVYSLRLKRVFRVPLDKIRKIRLRTASGDYVLAQRKDEWVWTDPVALFGQKVSHDRVNEIIIQLRDLMIKEFIDDGKLEPLQAGIMAGLGVSVSVWGEGELFEAVHLGHEVTKRDAFYATRLDEPALLLVARENIRRLFEIIQAEADKVNAGPITVPV